MLLNLDLDHVLTSIKVCTDREDTFIKGVQVSYGKFEGTEIIEDVDLKEIGNTDDAQQLCTNFYIRKGDELAQV